MLIQVEIQNFALIEHAVFTPAQGLTVISGETGAGKSLLIDAIGSLSGKRASRDWIRSGSDFARVEAVFEWPEQDRAEEALRQIVTRESEDDYLILSRDIRRDGRSLARINGRLVNLTLLKEVAACLIGLHAQHEQQSIYQHEQQRMLLDRFAGNAVKQLLNRWSELLTERKSLVLQLREYGLNPSERARQLDLLNYQIAEIEEADIRPMEDTDLLKRSKILSALNRIKQELSQCRTILSAEYDHGVATRLEEASRLLEYSARHVQSAKEIQLELGESARQILNLVVQLTDLQERLEADPGELAQIQKRLDLLENLKAKYGNTLDEVIEYHRDARSRLEKLQQGEKLFEHNRSKLQTNELALTQVAAQIHQARKHAAVRLSEAICRALQALAMPDVRFEVVVTAIDRSERGYYACHGRDKIEFLIQPNPGEPLKALAAIASGGEASRVLLALKSILADDEQLAVMIFDEIDTGVSGQTAVKVARMLRLLGRKCQVLCVSHTAQIAAAANHHWLIEKHVAAERSVTAMIDLSAETRIREVARLLSGDPEDRQTLELAQKMLAENASE